MRNVNVVEGTEAGVLTAVAGAVQREANGATSYNGRNVLEDVPVAAIQRSERMRKRTE